MAQDNFSSLSNSGGTGWSDSWNAGNFSAGDLQFTSNNSQTVSRNFIGPPLSPRPANNADGAVAGFHSIQYTIGFNINPALTDNQGFLMYQGGHNAARNFRWSVEQRLQRWSPYLCRHQWLQQLLCPDLRHRCLAHGFMDDSIVSAAMFYPTR